MELSEETPLSLQPNPSDLGFPRPSPTGNGDSDHETSDHRRAGGETDNGAGETKPGLSSQPDGDSSPDASDLALRELIAILVLKVCEDSVGSGSGNENVEVREDGTGGRIESDDDGGDDDDDEGKGESVKEVEFGNSGGDEWSERDGDESSGARRYSFPVRPEAEDCAFYLRTGSCKFGGHCKFNHPFRPRTNHHQVVKERTKEKEKEREPGSERRGQSECKFYMRSGGCKYGKSCKYNHPRTKAGTSPPTVAPTFELNFLGLPIRSGEKECPFYMRTGSCKYGSHCRFNHPDPTDAGVTDNSPGYSNGGGSRSTKHNSWSSPRSINEAVASAPAPAPAPAPALALTPAPFLPMMVPPSPRAPQNAEWNGYQAPLFLPPERNIPPPPPAYTMNNNLHPETNTYKHHPPQQEVEEYPERPGQPDCTYFLKTGDCKYRSNCKYHHPKNRGSTTKTPCTLSDKGLPLRPDQNICTHYGRYGICKFGPACKYDHSQVKLTSTVTGGDNQPLYGHGATMEGAGMSRSGSRSEVTIQQ